MLRAGHGWLRDAAGRRREAGDRFAVEDLKPIATLERCAMARERRACMPKSPLRGLDGHNSGTNGDGTTQQSNGDSESVNKTKAHSPCRGICG